MSDDELLRDENGFPLTSIFHKPPKKVNEIYWVRSRQTGKGWQREALKLFKALYPEMDEPIVDFHPDEVEE